MSLVPDYENSSSSDDSTNSSLSDNDEDSNQETVIPQSASSASGELPKQKRLPAPQFLSSQESKIGIEDNLTSSVFKNPFAEAENAKEAILQKHVKMVENMSRAHSINGKKICWNYRKGRCRFGHKCKFAHDSDLQQTQTDANDEHGNEEFDSSAVICHNQKTMPQPSDQDLEAIHVESMTENSKFKKRKRPGLSQGLVPGKKVLKKYHSQKK